MSIYKPPAPCAERSSDIHSVSSTRLHGYRLPDMSFTWSCKTTQFSPPRWLHPSETDVSEKRRGSALFEKFIAAAAAGKHDTGAMMIQNVVRQEGSAPATARNTRQP